MAVKEWVPPAGRDVFQTDYGVLYLRPTTAAMFNELRRKDGGMPRRGTKKAKAWADLEHGICTAAKLWWVADEDLKEI